MANKKKSEDKIKIQYLGGVEELTGSCTYIQIDGLHILIDFGMVQNSELSIDQLYKINSKPVGIDLSKIDYVIALHPHHDHISKIPILSNAEFEGKIICTSVTAKIMQLILLDSANIMQKEVTKINKKRSVNKLIPIYTKSDVENVMSFVQGYDFNREIYLNDKVKLTLLPAGHISGSAMAYIEFTISEYEKKRLLFTSDTSGIDRSIPFTTKPNIEKLKLDYIQIESTYGNREHEKIDAEKILEEYIRDTVLNKGKTLLIPSFAVSRCTNIILMIYKLFKKYTEFKDIELYLASPMSIDAHSIIGQEDNFDFYDAEWHEYKYIFKWDKLQLISDFEVVQKELINDKPKVIISASGMCEAGFIRYLLANYLSQKGHKVLFSGYQASGTLGRKLIDGIAKSVTIDGIQIPIRADIDILPKMSGHASCSELINMLKTVEKKKIKKIILNHGQEEAKQSLREKLKEEFDCEIIIPHEMQIIKI